MVPQSCAWLHKSSLNVSTCVNQVNGIETLSMLYHYASSFASDAAVGMMVKPPTKVARTHGMLAHLEERHHVSSGLVVGAWAPRC